MISVVDDCRCYPVRHFVLPSVDFGKNGAKFKTLLHTNANDAICFSAIRMGRCVKVSVYLKCYLS